MIFWLLTIRSATKAFHRYRAFLSFNIAIKKTLHDFFCVCVTAVGVACGNGQRSSVGFTTNMRSAYVCGQVTERLTFLLELRFPNLDPASFEGYSKKTTLL